MKFEDIARALGEDDSETRRGAVAALAGGAGDDVAGLIVRGLADTDWRVRKEAARVAGALVTGELDGTRNDGLYDALVEATVQGDNVGLRNSALEVFALVGPLAAPGLLDALERVPNEAVKFIIEGLGHTRSAEAIAVLRASSRSDDPNIAAAALDALARVGGVEAERALRERLRVTNSYQRFAALDALDRLGAEVSWPDLQPLLGDRMLRRVALRVLGRTDSIDALEPLVESLLEPSAAALRASAVSILELTRRLPAAAVRASSQLANLDDRARTRVRELLLSRESLPTRRAAAQILVWARDEESLPGILGVAAEGQLPDLALQALKVWGLEAVPALLRLVTHSNASIGAVALEVAADLTSGPAVELEAHIDPALAQQVRRAIREASESKERPIALAVASCFTWWAEAQDASRLVRLAERFDEGVAKDAAGALDALADRAPDAVRAVLSNAVLDRPSGAALVGVLARLAGEESLERVQTSLSSDSPVTRSSAITALATLGGPLAVEHIALALADEEVDVQIAAAVALGGFENDPERASEHLLLALQSEAAPVRAAAARALGRLAVENAVEPLRLLVRDESAQVALAAVEGLRRVGAPDAVNAYVESLGHADTEVVKEGLRAIRAAEGERAVERVAVGLAHGAWDVRRLAAQLLGELGPSGLPHLQARLGSETDALVRTAVADALERGRRGGGNA